MKNITMSQCGFVKQTDTSNSNTLPESPLRE